MVGLQAIKKFLQKCRFLSEYNSVTELKRFTKKRIAGSVTSIGSKLYVIGGQSVCDTISDQRTKLLDSVEMFGTSNQTDVNPDKPTELNFNGDLAILV
ncbi:MULTISPECIES: kelch motif-containing protein [Bacillus amyloliquefaciens group]|uniref:kelch motif-containing protein n=1 Tax=Bacillus amyloliquefaciens group TaxID=1938374 RepID=UPI000C820EA5|nr:MULTISPECIES: kelch motif-containing protein [Bacillus amyloliquefaciens group]MED4523821.1 kelch motif-containing protein [Bacillus velezensis]